MDGKNTESNYRWYILFLLGLSGSLAFAMPQMCMPVLFKEISEELNLSLVQIGTVWGLVPFAGLFVILLGGMLADRFGTKRILVIGCFLAGVAGISRGFANSFFTLAASMFLFGLLMVITAPSLIRACGVWFQGRHLSLATGVLSMSMGLGFLVSSLISATVLSPLLGGWRNVLFMYGFLSIGMSILWAFTRSSPGHEVSPTDTPVAVPFREGLLHLLRNKRVWALGLMMAGQVGCILGMLGYLPLYLRDMGWQPAAADGAVATFHAVSTVFTVPIVLLSNKLKSRITLMFIAVVVTAIGVGLMSVAHGAGMWIAVVIAGIVRDGFMALQMTVLLETKGVGIKYAGTGIGMVQMLSRIGECIAPPVGNSLANIRPGYPFLFWSGMATLALGAFYLMKEKRDQETSI